MKNLSRWEARFPKNDQTTRFFSPREPVLSDWLSSRRALVDALENLAPADDEIGNCHLSLSHTGKNEDAACVVIGAVSSSLAGIGVDLESEARFMGDRAFRRIHQEAELRFEADPLVHWVLKEACWKAHPRAVETMVSHYEITAKEAGDDQAMIYRLRCTSVPCEFRAVVLREQGFLFAVAVTPAVI